jgi:hypothetical protein
MLDNLLPVTNSSSSWLAKIDLPDRYVKLLIDMICKTIYQQTSKPVPESIEQTINQGLMNLSQNLQANMQAEQIKKQAQ